MNASRQHGHTILHLVIALSIGIFVIFVATESFSATSNLNTDAQVRLRSNEDLRRNLESLANVLRGADFDTITGLNANGPTTGVQFARVEGADRFGQQLGPVEEIRWQPSPRAVPGLESPGWLEHRSAAGSRLIADRVPMNGLRVALDAGVLTIDAQTYSVVQNQLVMSRASTSVVPRN